MDIYLIAGQSNASGFTVWTVDDETVHAELAAHPVYAEGFENVLYYGSPDEPPVGKLCNCSLGLGVGRDYIGPELGMADVLSGHYGEEKICIMKYAIGGSTLMKQTQGGYNWLPPSLVDELQEPKSPNTGVFYRNLLTVVRDGLAALREKGYSDFHVKGLYWMQGESDRDECERYLFVFERFCRELRADLSAIFGTDLSRMPILVGEIARNFEDEVSEYNTAFLSAQHRIPSIVPECHIIENAKYPVHLVGGDPYHWGFFEQLNIGKDVGNYLIHNLP